MANRPVAIPPEATAKAWDLTETLTFDRSAAHPAITATAVARAVGVTGQSVRSWEEGEYLPGLAAFVAWADFLGYDVALIPREGS